MGKKTPDAPDYTAAAEAQGQSSRNVTEQQTWANRPDQNTPFGSQTWANTPTYDPSTGQMLNRWTQNTTLTPEAQAALDSQMQMQQGRSDLANSIMPRVNQEFGKAMDWGGFKELQGSPDVPTYSPMSFQSSIDPAGRIQSQGPRAAPVRGEQIQRGIGDTAAYNKQAGDAIYGQWADRALPQQQQDTERMRTQLYNTGLREGDAAYDDQMKKLQQSQGDAQQQASYQATIGSGQEAQRMQGMDVTQGNFANSAAQQALQQNMGLSDQRFGQQLQAGNFANQAQAQQFGQNAQQGSFANNAAQQALAQQLAIGGQQFNQGQSSANQNNQLRQQQIAEAMQQRGFSLNEINAIISGQQVGMPSMPGFNTAAAAQPVGYSQAAGQQYQASLDAANAQNAGLGNLLGGATSLGSTAMMFSDRRLKKNIRRIGSVKGVPLYEFQYVWGTPGVGVMADEATHIPGAVHQHSSGYLMVDYGVIYGR